MVLLYPPLDSEEQSDKEGTEDIEEHPETIESDREKSRWGAKGSRICCGDLVLISLLPGWLYRSGFFRGRTGFKPMISAESEGEEKGFGLLQAVAEEDKS